MSLIIASASTTLLILTWAFILLRWSFPDLKKPSREDFINQNFDFIKKTEEKGEWIAANQQKATVYNPYKDQDKIMSGKNESYFLGKTK